ncbi:hypothetical protein EVAR_5742_1 [Eumeta japonica]|uniref:Uncharacterized protein n=1 Tax=Eumeta variegata TaxID=151549 RepID=A0A4C1T4G1_EUMVA|nr:hypothetical protein EVAR_5742_1 [Eumeta japonica]
MDTCEPEGVAIAMTTSWSFVLRSVASECGTKLRYTWGNALRDTDCLGPDGAPYPSVECKCRVLKEQAVSEEFVEELEYLNNASSGLKDRDGGPGRLTLVSRSHSIQNMTSDMLSGLNAFQ